MTFAKDMVLAHPGTIDIDIDVLSRCIDECLSCAQSCIACTDACSAEETIHRLLTSGVDVFRLNFSHGTPDERRRVIEVIRHTATDLGKYIPIMGDIQGPKLRIGDVDGVVQLQTGQTFTITTEPVIGNASVVSTPFTPLPREVQIGQRILIKAAAVADYTPVAAATRKIIKEQGSELTLSLQKNPHILESVAGATPRPFIVAFAAETEAVEANAREKLRRKNADLIVANDVSDASIGFDSDDNEVLVIARDGATTRIAKAPKMVIANRILDLVLEHLPRD